MNDKIFIDSNIFLYAFTQKDIQKHSVAQNIIMEPLSISIQVINEVSKNMLYKFAFSNKNILDFINDAYIKYKVFDVNRDVFIKAVEFRTKYNVSYYDSIILSTAYSNCCDIIYSEDLQNNQIFFAKLKVVNPFCSIKC